MLKIQKIIVNDTVLTVFSQFEKIAKKESFKSYLFSTASNINKMRFRREKFKASFEVHELNQIIDGQQDQETLADFSIIYDKMMLLPQKYREALILFYISDLKIEEIQKIQGCSVSAVKQRLKRGRKKLLNLLDTKQQVRAMLFMLTF
jgi:RNA polymerase sigma-70 factor (ECF subfamily)